MKNIKGYVASFVMTLLLGVALAAELVWMHPMGLGGVALFCVLEYLKIYTLRNGPARWFHKQPPVIGFFAGKAAALLVMLWLASGLVLAGAVTERMVIALVVGLLLELISISIPAKDRSERIPFGLMYAAAGKAL